MGMDYFNKFKRLEYLLEIIEKGQALSPTILANKFNCSEKTIRRMINDLRMIGHDVSFCRKKMIYFIQK